MRKILFLLPVLALAFTGCALLNPGVKVPKTSLSVETKAWSVELKSEKDTKLEAIDVNVQPDGAVAVKLSNFVATNSPVVIRETGKAQALTIDSQGRVMDATGKVIGQVVNGAIQLFTK